MELKKVKLSELIFHWKNHLGGYLIIFFAAVLIQAIGELNTKLYLKVLNTVS